MTFQTRKGLDQAAATAPRLAVCAMIEQYFGSTEPSPQLIADNVVRLRRQLDALGVEQVVGLGDIPPGASLLLLRGDVLFEFSTLQAMAHMVGRGAHIDDTLAAVHVEAGDAAAALSKFRREETTGWAPFQIQFTRLGKFREATAKTNPLALFMRRRSKPIAKAALLAPDGLHDRAGGKGAWSGPIPVPEPPEPGTGTDAMASVWLRSPGLDPIVRLRKVLTLQKDACDAFAIKPSAWQGIGFLLLLMTLSFGALGWGWLGAAVGLLAAGCFDLAERASDLKELRLSKSSSGLCVQALVIACLWLFVVFAAGAGSTAQMPAVVLMLLPVAFVVAQATGDQPSLVREAAFGVYVHAILAALSVAMLPVPLVSLAFSGAALLLLLAGAVRAFLLVTTSLAAARRPAAAAA